MRKKNKFYCTYVLYLQKYVAAGLSSLRVALGFGSSSTNLSGTSPTIIFVVKIDAHAIDRSLRCLVSLGPRELSVNRTR